MFTRVYRDTTLEHSAAAARTPAARNVLYEAERNPAIETVGGEQPSGAQLRSVLLPGRFYPDKLVWTPR